MKKEKKTYYYQTYNDDFVETQDPNYKLPEDYIWIHNNIIYKICSRILYFIAYIFGVIYCKLFLHVKVQNRRILKKYKNTGYFLYGNHTQPLGDVFIPSRVTRTKRTYVIGNPTNLKVKGIGPFLPIIGILPIPNSIMKMKELLKAVGTRIEEKNVVVIYPEAHVWPYYTKIRPFSDGSLKFQVDLKVPSFCMTTTYYKRKLGTKPGVKVFLDGPFLVDDNISKKENQKKLCSQIYKAMVERSKNSTYEYAQYIEKNKVKSDIYFKYDL